MLVATEGFRGPWKLIKGQLRGSHDTVVDKEFPSRDEHYRWGADTWAISWRFLLKELQVFLQRKHLPGYDSGPGRNSHYESGWWEGGEVCL